MDANATIIVSGILTFATGNTIDNAGLLVATGSGAELVVDTAALSSSATDDGAGKWRGHRGNGSNGSPDALENVDNTVTGDGMIGD